MHQRKGRLNWRKKIQGVKQKTVLLNKPREKSLLKKLNNLGARLGKKSFVSPSSSASAISWSPERPLRSIALKAGPDCGLTSLLLERNKNEIK
jgi:hypothetical protein